MCFVICFLTAFVNTFLLRNAGLIGISADFQYFPSHMKKFAEVCLYNQCIIFIAAATNHVNTNVLMMWQKTQTFTLKSVLLSL